MGEPAEKIADGTGDSGAGLTAEEKKVAVLLEDSTPNRRIMATILTKVGFEVKEAINGKEGLTIVNECFDNGIKIDLFMSDIMMPEMDGFQFLEKIRTKSELDAIPFVFVTALANKDDIKRAQEMKASGYLLKPIVANQMLKKIVALFPDLDGNAKKLMAGA